MSDYQPNKIIPGTVYQVVQLLGQGGMGTVYEVEDTTVGKRYVLKTLHAALRDRKELATRLNKEARTLARLSHPNIVEVVTAGMTADALKLPYFVMQKLNGHTLRSVLNAKGSLPLETAYSIAIDLLDALDHAHAIGVIHRDVKPENIFLHRGPNDTHQTKLLDFGVMRMLSGDQALTGSRFVGTLRYAPPEQLTGGEVTPRNDLYTAGLVLFEMIAGLGPFDDETTDREVATAHITKKAPLLSTKALVPPALDRLVDSALAKDPEARPRDAFTFAARLRAIAREAEANRGDTTSTPPPSVSPASAPFSLTAKGTLRMFVSPAPDSRNAPTRAATPTELTPPDAARMNATTTGAVESHVSDEIPAKRRRPWVTVGVALVAVLGVAGIAGLRQVRGRAPSAQAGSSASVSTPLPATPTPSAAPPAAPTPSAEVAPPIGSASPSATAPAPSARPLHRPHAAPAARPKSRLPPSDL